MTLDQTLNQRHEDLLTLLLERYLRARSPQWFDEATKPEVTSYARQTLGDRWKDHPLYLLQIDLLRAVCTRELGVSDFYSKP